MLVEPEVPIEPEGFPVEHRAWDVPWLDDHREVPENACWPRLMTPPHPLAVGSLVDGCGLGEVRGRILAA